MIVSVDASPAPAGNSRQGGGKKSGKPPAGAAPPSSIWKVVWSAADANGDDLIYDLYYRGRGERNWKLLADDLTESSFSWMVDSAPEGTMEVRVVASDRRSNPATSALSAERISAPFDIDHTSPLVSVRVQEVASRRVTLECEVEDLTSPLKAAAYSLDAQDWRPVFPADGLFDEPTETVRIDLSGLTAGEHSVVVRAVDVLGNVGVGRAVLEVE